jgi:hypothetical protein
MGSEIAWRKLSQQRLKAPVKAQVTFAFRPYVVPHVVPGYFSQSPLRTSPNHLIRRATPITQTMSWLRTAPLICQGTLEYIH